VGQSIYLSLQIPHTCRLHDCGRQNGRLTPGRFDSRTYRRPARITRRARLRVGRRAARSFPERRPATPASGYSHDPRSPTRAQARNCSRTTKGKAPGTTLTGASRVLGAKGGIPKQDAPS
jgi:hypothetical protein